MNANDHPGNHRQRVVDGPGNRIVPTGVAAAAPVNRSRGSQLPGGIISSLLAMMYLCVIAKTPSGSRGVETKTTPGAVLSTVLSTVKGERAEVRLVSWACVSEMPMRSSSGKPPTSAGY